MGVMSDVGNARQQNEFLESVVTLTAIWTCKHKNVMENNFLT